MRYGRENTAHQLKFDLTSILKFIFVLNLKYFLQHYSEAWLYRNLLAGGEESSIFFDMWLNFYDLIGQCFNLIG